MSSYDDAPPEAQAATDKMMAEIEQAGLDYARVAAIQVGHHLDEEALMLLRTGINAGLAATIEWLTKHDALKGY